MGGISEFKDNPNAPKVRFVRKNGRIIPIIGKKKVVSAAPLVDERISDMIHEVKAAEKGGRGVSYNRDSGAAKAFKTYSTFPSWYKDIGFRSKKDFEQTILKQSGVKYDRLGAQAIEDLTDGFQTSFGRVPPNLAFRVKTRQTFDNRGVSFRTIEKKVRPMRFNDPF